ncbi:MAG: hypothetical protein HUK21_08655 [Fibrobacteraceae bacterium]|nr:hypothetical protein [Fibrobacteraceae bacterium]
MKAAVPNRTDSVIILGCESQDDGNQKENQPEKSKEDKKMICQNCNQELPFEAGVVEKMKLCPFCGKELFSRKEVVESELNECELALKKAADEAGGLDIFNDENRKRLSKIFFNWSNAEEAMELQIANQLNIPQKLYEILDAPMSSKKSVVTDCINAFEVLKEISNKSVEIVARFAHVLGLDCQVKKEIKDPFKECDSGTFVDERDGEKYKWVRIGKQIWMAENLRYYEDGSYAYDNNAKNTLTCGRLYNEKKVKAVCPKGWRLPTTEEWKILEKYIECKSHDNAGTLLKSKNSGGANAYGLCVSMTGEGYKGSNMRFQDMGEYANFISTNGVISFYKTDIHITYKALSDSYYYSIRCIKDE